jgi:FixJ family two-component response regulator
MLQTATVFVVDDDVSVRESLAALVRFAGWPVLTVSSAQAASCSMYLFPT